MANTQMNQCYCTLLIHRMYSWTPHVYWNSQLDKAQIDHHLGIPAQLHKCYIPLARSGLCTVLLDSPQGQTFRDVGIDDQQDRPDMLWNGWVQTVPQDILWAMYHLDIRTPLGILYMLHYPPHCKNPLDMPWVLMQGFHNGNLLDKWYIVFALYCCYRNQIHKVWVVDLYLDKKIQQDIPNRNKRKWLTQIMISL